jgi:hypothetical protein
MNANKSILLNPRLSAFSNDPNYFTASDGKRGATFAPSPGGKAGDLTRYGRITVRVNVTFSSPHRQ